uniref:Uncharacterized protein n=1 Tax=Arundo donax TaxID=35708 RepID=A0A0A8YJ02_ARUDO
MSRRLASSCASMPELRSSTRRFTRSTSWRSTALPPTLPPSTACSARCASPRTCARHRRSLTR